ncbi:Protein suppressor of white apricot [Frankliniella fusca]|uniref:Protein suppressor of white apricot n=1 Tax=Frankliniella fusca TaxID=407009 RepID=A0AAE1LQV8_9NEOP|nr:Protein suppressor of white apricot [Frankliniella fusca]
MASARPPRFDSSALKKKEETEDLLVFGYSCKLFRDDEKALFIDQGKHLIPWMGDDTLKIDRYDVRGTVYDLRPLEPLGGGASDALWSTLSDAERKVEQLCDEERYRALYHNEAEEALYQEEELKRLHKALDPQNSYGQVAYSYDEDNEQNISTEAGSKEPSEAADEEDEPFIPPPELDVPVGMVLPERTKLNAIIEKTAAFINAQGPQMEIILKMKQANNPQFSFLSFDCPLHAYYRHVLMAIKTGRYLTRQQRDQQEQNETENSEDYLHPSLSIAAKPVELVGLWLTDCHFYVSKSISNPGDNQLLISDFRASLKSKVIGDMLDLIELVDKCLGAPSIPSISYKPSADCAYSVLVNKIKARQGKLTDDSSGPGSPGDGVGKEDNTQVNHSIVAPPPDIQVIIDKMASYVIKNGRDFEAVVRSKGDERFAFLDIGHKYNPYYEHKVRVYQGLEPPLTFSQAATSSSVAGSQKPNQDSVKKKVQTDKVPRPILLPGYEYSDDSSESDSDQENSRTDQRGKPKLAPVCFSIKKPKEAEILKEVKSALPIEEESSEGEGEGENESGSKQSNVADAKPVQQNDEEKITSAAALANPEEEMRRLQQLLKEKEKQLRDQEKQRKLNEKRNQDIFPTESKPKIETESPPPPLPPQPVGTSPLAKDPIEERVVDVTEGNQTAKEQNCQEVMDCKLTEKSTELQKDLVDKKSISKESDELMNVMAEAEVIDLTEETDEAPKVTETMRMERKRKAAAFLSRLQKERHLSKNGNAQPNNSDSDAASRHSTPSPTLLKREKQDMGTTNFHEAGIPKTSLMSRLAASSHLPRQPIVDKKKMSKELRKSESPVKSGKGKDEKSYHKQRNKRRKEPSSSSDSEPERARSRSRSISYSRSPLHKRRQGDESDSEQRSHRHHREGRSNSHRKKHDVTETTETPRDHSPRRHHRRREDERRGHSLSHAHSRMRPRGQGRSQSHNQSHIPSKRTDSQVSESDDSE